MKPNWYNTKNTLTQSKNFITRDIKNLNGIDLWKSAGRIQRNTLIIEYFIKAYMQAPTWPCIMKLMGSIQKTYFLQSGIFVCLFVTI